jgi:hypothetical protein
LRVTCGKGRIKADEIAARQIQILRIPRERKPRLADEEKLLQMKRSRMTDGGQIFPEHPTIQLSIGEPVRGQVHP